MNEPFVRLSLCLTQIKPHFPLVANHFPTSETSDRDNHGALGTGYLAIDTNWQTDGEKNP